MAAAAMMEALAFVIYTLSINMRPGCIKKKMNATKGPRISDSPATLFTDKVPMISPPV